MRFFSTVLVAFTALSALVLAQDKENPIHKPTSGDKFGAGDTITIEWTPTTDDDTVHLVLRKGDEDNLDPGTPIDGNVPNTGSFTWKVPEDLPAGEDYTIEISWDGGTNFSPKFTLDSDVVNTTTAKLSSTESETSTTETSTTETSTTETTETTETETTETSIETTEVTSTTTSEYSTITSPPNATTTTSSSTTSRRPPRTTGDLVDNADRGGDASSHSASVALLLCVGTAWLYLL
jgi:hypothetical protein